MIYLRLIQAATFYICRPGPLLRRVQRGQPGQPGQPAGGQGREEEAAAEAAHALHVAAAERARVALPAQPLPRHVGQGGHRHVDQPHRAQSQGE